MYKAMIAAITAQRLQGGTRCGTECGTEFSTGRGTGHGTGCSTQLGSKHGSQHGSQHGSEHGSQHGSELSSQHGTQRRTHHSTQRGVTAVELMIVLSIAAILAAAALPSFAPTIQRYRATTAANDLQRAFALARAQSLAVGDRVVVAPMSNGDWRTGWRVFVDANSNGSFEAGDTALQVFEALPAGMGTQSSANFALDGGQFVSFNAFGQPRALNGTSFADGNVLLTFGDVTRRVCVDARGRAAVVSGACP